MSARTSTRETPIKDRCLRYLRKLSHSKWEKRHGTQYARTGAPDIFGCYMGYHFEFEVKREGEDVTERQADELVEWGVAGAAWAAVRSPADCRRVLLPFLTPADREVKP